jgi:predicted PurR-regulated permease PerM
MTEGAQLTLWRVVQATAVLLVLGLFLYSTRAVLNPVLLFVLLWAVLVPFRGSEGHVALLATAATLTVVWLLSTTGSLLAPFVLSLVLAYMLDPLADRLTRRGVSRTLAILALTIPAIGVLGVLVLVVLPAAVQELGDVIEQAPVFFERLAGWIESWGQWLATVNIPLINETQLLERMRGVDAEAVVSFLQERQQALAASIWGAVLGVGRGIGSFFTVLGYVALTPVLSFYLLRDWDRLTAAVERLLPAGRRSAYASFARDCDDLVSKYLRGQITVAVVIGTITGLGLWIASFPYAGTLGLIVTIFSVIPYLGLVLSLIPAIFIALVSGSVWVSLLKIAIVYGAAQFLEASVVSPRIVGESVGLHPVWVVLALALGGFFFGFVGLLIGVPLAAIAKLLLERGLDRYRSSGFYRKGEAAGSG